MQNKPNRRPLAGNSKHEILNPKRVDFKDHYFKEQTQFRGGQYECKCLFQKVFMTKNLVGGGEKTKPIKAKYRPLAASSKH